MPYVVFEANSNQRIDNFLLSLNRELPKTFIYKLIRTGQIRINGSRCQAMKKLNHGDQVRIPPNFASKHYTELNSNNKYQWIEKKIIYQDENIIAINKPAGLAVHSGSKNNIGLIDILRSHYQNKNLQLTHRIDKLTSGIVIISKNLQTLQNINIAFSENLVKKEYYAIVDGNIKKKYIVTSKIVKKPGKSIGVMIDNINGANAKTIIEPIKSSKNSSLVKATPLTGRTHQIRIHLASINHPISNDKLYNPQIKSKNNENNIYLHAHKIHIPNIVTAKAPLPQYFNSPNINT